MLTYSWATQGRGRAATCTTATRSLHWSLPRRLARVAAIGIVLAVLALGGVARAATIIVTSRADPYNGSGCVLRDAITAANTEAAVNGCTAGTGTDTINFSVTGTIMLTSTLPAIANVAPNSLTINGSGQRITVNGNNAVEVMVVNSGATLSLANLTIADGNTTLFGGGIYNNGGMLTVSNSTFSGNRTTDEGGGIANADGGMLTVSNSTFSGNSATNNGGGIFNVDGGMLTVSNSTFSGNSATEDGGGIYNFGTLTVSNSTFSGNSATEDGGGIENDSTLTVVNSTFSGNSGGDFGAGGIVNDVEGTLTVVNSTFSGNSGGLAGGILNGGTQTVVNSTFSGNSGGDFGAGGIYNAGTVNLKGTILAAAGASGPNCYNINPITDEGYNLSDDGSCDFTSTTSQNSVLDTQLKLGPLQNNGGPTQTIALDTGSVAIDAIPLAKCTYQNVNPCTNPPTISSGSTGALVCDQRGEPRPSPGQNACDIGAFELQQTVPFAQFKAALGIDLPDSFALLGTFVPGSGGTINPVTQAVTLTFSSAELAPVTLTIPAGSFKKVLSQYVFEGEVEGVKVAAVISAPFQNSYGFAIGADGLELTGVSNPVTVTLQVGANSGTTTVKALIE